MWKLVIADDEPKIRRGLSKALPWAELNIEVAGEAEDGAQALELAQRLRPDILFVDICMPNMDGLEFIAKLREHASHCVIIVISGHDEFRYAQQALQLNVFDYLLKPVERDKLEQVVVQAIDRLKGAREKEREEAWRSRQLRMNEDALRDVFLIKWVNGLHSEEEIHRNLAFFELGFDGPGWLIALKVAQRLDTGKERRVWDPNLLEFAVANIAGDVLRDMFDQVSCVFNDKKGRLVLFGKSAGSVHWADIGDKLQDKIEKLLEKPVMMELQPIPDGIAGLPGAYRELVKELDAKGRLSPIIALSKKYIDKHYDRSTLTLGDVADSIQVSPTYLSKQLKRELGLSFIDYLTEIRIRKAIHWMNDPHIKVYEIAEKVGYSSQHYFSSAFKKVTGASPIAYRKGIHE
ncbi:response regulator transcription factor [Cohnella terricola]|nr:response regulator [Cohnella terricola]